MRGLPRRSPVEQWAKAGAACAVRAAKPLALLVALALAAAILSAQRPGRRAVTPPRAASPPAERPVPFAVGEQLTYDISWSSFLTAGAATVTVRDKKPSYTSTAYYITAEGEPTGIVSVLYPVYYKVDALLDVYSLLPQRASIYSRERGREQMKVTLFDPGRRRATYEVGASPERKTTTTLDAPAGTEDPLSAMFVLRTMTFKAGTRTMMPVTFNGEVYRMEITMGGREQVRAMGATRSAWRLTPVVVGRPSATAPRGMTVWIGDDRKHLPLRMEVELPIGSFNIVLRTAR